MSEAIVLRPATMKDASLLLEWRNDPETRRSSHSTEVVEFQEHVEWLSRVLGNPDRALYVAECDGVPVGTVRADRSIDDTELSWTVAPIARGNGIAKRMVACVASRIDGPFGPRSNQAISPLAESQSTLAWNSSERLAECVTILGRAEVRLTPNKALQPTFDPSRMVLPHHARRLKRG